MSQKIVYKDSSQPVSQRVEDLLSRMTLEEKVGQLMQLDGQGKLEDLIGRLKVGSLLHLNGSDADRAIRMSLETRLGIPVLMADDGIHGHSFWAGATIFPTQLGMAGSWNPGLMKEAARVTAREMRATGIKWTFSPVLCLTRDLRWGRVGETFGEDPYLIGEFASAMIDGYQGLGLDDPDAVLATAKHFAGYSETIGGRDASEADLSRRRLRSYFLPPFERAARDGTMAFMTGYQSMDGVPATANKWLLKEVLRDEWRFEGILITDWNNVANLVADQKVCKDMAEAATLAIKSGNDMMMASPSFFDGAIEAVSHGMLTLAEIDTVVRRVLALKFRMGLFEDPGLSDVKRQKEQIGCEAHTAVNLSIARESLVLLKNNGVLPISADSVKTLKRILVVGPNADDPLAQLGDWSLGSGQMRGGNGPAHPRAKIITVLDGLRSWSPDGWAVEYVSGCSILNRDTSGIPKAIEAASTADLIVMVLGDRLELIGETKSTATLELMGGQVPLADAVVRTGKPVITVLINSKPLSLPDSVLSSAAIIEVFNPGMQGGRAIADAIFGRINPSGKLTVSFPYHVGQQPVYYNYVRGQHGHRYADMTQDPAFAFGFGLSYTTFAYSGLHVWNKKLGMGETARFDITLTNTGARKGTEITQLYISDLVTSATWAIKELKGYRRTTLEPGESTVVSFELPASECWIVDAKGNKIVEPGEFQVLIGGSSRSQDLLCGHFEIE